MNNRGLILREPEKGDYIQDTRLRLGAIPLQPDGQWDAYLPPSELQSANGFETLACTSYGTLAAVEALIRREFNESPEYSDRFLAEASGTTAYGNDAHTVAETLRKKGVPPESDWPSAGTKSWGEFYQTPPENVKSLAKTFNYEFDFAHQYVKTDQQSMMNALTSSPIGVDVYAWNTPVDGIYHRNGNPSTHWVCIYGYEKNNYWKVFDSYDSTKKRISWDYGFTMAKGYSLHKSVIVESAWQTFIRLLRSILSMPSLDRQPEDLPYIPASVPPVMAPDAPKLPPETTSPPKATLLWDTPQNAFHSVRVICDDMGLTLDEKNLICAVIMGESEFNNKATFKNPKSTDWGICQINDYFHIGKSKTFPSVDYVLENPKVVVNWMIEMYRAGHLDWWIAYKNGSYKKFLLKSSRMWSLKVT